MVQEVHMLWTDLTTFGVVQTARQEKLYDNNNMTDDKPTEKRTPDRDSAQKNKLKSVVLVVPRTNEEVWKGFARRVDGSYKGDEIPRRGFRF